MSSADEKLIEAHLTWREGELMLAEGYRFLARTSDLDCDPEIRSRRLRDGYLRLADGHTVIAKANEMVAEAGRMHLSGAIDCDFDEPSEPKTDEPRG